MQSKVTRKDVGLAKNLAHSWFDCLWEEGWMQRHEAYAWLANEMEIPEEECHFWKFDVGMCEAAIAIIEPKLIEFRREWIRGS